MLGNFGLGVDVSADVSGALNSGLKVASNWLPGLQGAGNFAGTGEFSLGFTGAGNVNGNINVDGPLSNPEQNDGTDVGITDEYYENFNYDDIDDTAVYNPGDWENLHLRQNSDEIDDESQSIGNHNLDDVDSIGNHNLDDIGFMQTYDDVVDDGPQQGGNINSQSNIQQHGVGNSNTQGGIIQHGHRRSIQSISPLPKQHFVCGFVKRIIYPDYQLHGLNVDSEPVLMSNIMYR